MAFMLFFVFAHDMFFYAGLRRTVPRFCLRLCSLAVAVREVVLCLCPLRSDLLPVPTLSSLFIRAHGERFAFRRSGALRARARG